MYQVQQHVPALRLIFALMLLLPLPCLADGEAEPLVLSDEVYFDQQEATPVEPDDKPEAETFTAEPTPDQTAQRTETTPKEIVTEEPQETAPQGAVAPAPTAIPRARAQTIASASDERVAAAAGHYARARAMLIAAVREFDQGMKKADASPLLDVDQWRTSVIANAEELQRVLDPQPRSSRTGVRFQGDSRLLGEAP